MKMKRTIIKITKKFITIILVAALILSISPNISAKAKPDKSKKKDIEINYPEGNKKLPEKTDWMKRKEKTDAKSNQLIVKYKNDGLLKKSGSKNKVKNNLNLTEIKVKKNFKNQKTEVLEFSLQDRGKGLGRIKDELEKDSNIEYVQLNYRLDINTLPDDNGQWALLNTGAEVEGETGRAGVDMSIAEAWGLETGSQDVLIGVLDTGIDITHEDLINSIYINTNEIAGNNEDDDGNGYVDDINGWDFYSDDNSVYDDIEQDLHGTQMAGIIAAEHNANGISGVAPGVKLLPLKFIDGYSGYTCDALEAIEYAIEMGVDIINCSFGGTDENIALKEAIENSGILFVCSAGNRGGDLNDYSIYPAAFDCDNILSVASMDNNGTKDIYSGYGSLVDIAAPGINILTTFCEDVYDYISGTSAAAANATGVAALLKSYDNTLDIQSIKSRIMNYGVNAAALLNKVNSGRRIDAYGALTEVEPAQDIYTDPDEEDPLQPGGDGYEDDTWYTSDQHARIQEQLHYGSSGVNMASGNYSFSTNDMGMKAPGFTITISRTYNSKSMEGKLLGKGWTFGFESWLEGTDLVTVYLPSGSIARFRKQDDDSYKAEDSRSVFVKNGNNTYTLTTSDQYKYYYGTNNYITKMEDRDGNYVDIITDADKKITAIRDCVGREFTIDYNQDNLIDNIIDPTGRKVEYRYINKRLVEYEDVENNIIEYQYDGYGYITAIKDAYDNKLIELEYNHNDGGGEHRVKKATDQKGSVVEYTYDKANRKTTAKENDYKIWTYSFDKEMYILKVTDPIGRTSETIYKTIHTGGKNKYGDISRKTDFNGFTTRFETNDVTGNIEKIINPDLTFKEFGYDSKNNKTLEIDEEGFRTEFIYDANKIKLLKTVQPLTDIDAVYGDTDYNDDDFIITEYEYYTSQYAQDNFNCSAKGLLKSVTIQGEPDINGNLTENTTTFTYNQYGNIHEQINPGLDKVVYTYNDIGWKQTMKTGIKNESDIGYTTVFDYNNYGHVTKTTFDDGSISRVYYDRNGRQVQSVSPKAYDSNYEFIPADPETEEKSYTGPNSTIYNYSDKGQLESVTDPMGYITTYVYDIYGNKEKQIMDDGSMHIYEYDKLNRIKKELFKSDAAAEPVLLKEYSYYNTSNDTVEKAMSVYIDDTTVATSTGIYNYAGKLIEQQNPDGTVTKASYYDNMMAKCTINKRGSLTFFTYDNIKRMTASWTPFEIKNGDTYYTLSANEYYHNGLVKKNAKYIETIPLTININDEYDTINSYLENKIPVATDINSLITENTYDKNGNLKITSSTGGKKTEFAYNNSNKVKKSEAYTSLTEKLVTEFEYDYAGRVLKEIKTGNAEDIYSFNETGDIIQNAVDDNQLITEYTYDKNGNLETTITPDDSVVTFEYDYKNNQTKTIQDGYDEENNVVNDITTEKVYDYAGRVKEIIDPKEHKIINEYDKRGNLVKTKTTVKDRQIINDVETEVTEDIILLMKYNRAGMVIAEVTPENYKTSDIVEDMARSEFEYYINGKLKCKKNIYKDENGTEKTILTSTMEYDRSGNLTVIKDPLGNETKTTYNLANLQITSLDPVSNDRGLPYTSKTEYDALGRAITMRNAKGVVTKNYFNDAENTTKTTIKENLLATENTLSEVEKDLAGRVKTSKNADGAITSTLYNSFGLPSKITLQGDETIDAYIAEMHYDKMSRLIREFDNVLIDGKYKEKITRYDWAGRIESVTEQNNDGTEAIKTSNSYDIQNNIISTTDPNDNITVFEYDELGRRIKEIYKVKNINDEEITKISKTRYNKDSNPEEEENWLGNVIKKEYDELGRLVKTIDPYNKIIAKMTYDDAGNQKTITDAIDNTTVFDYDKLGRVILTTDPRGHKTAKTYDDTGNIETTIDGNNNVATYEYDFMGRLEKVINPLGESTSYNYSLSGNLLSQTNGEGFTTSFDYNIRGMLKKKTDPFPALYEEFLTYYPNGNVKTKEDKMGREENYTYDIHGRLKVQDIDGDIISYEYDNNGNILEETNENGTIMKEYDSEGRVISKTVIGIGETRYEYDITTGLLPGEVKDKTITPLLNPDDDPLMNTTERVFDKAGRLKSVKENNNTTKYDYHDNGLKWKVTYPGDNTEEYLYYENSELMSLVNKRADNTIIDEYSYEIDGANNRIKKTDARGETDYYYDTLNRLETVSEPIGRTTTYVYDKAGNREQETVNYGALSSQTVYSYDELNRLTSTNKTQNGTIESTDYLYDNCGNMVKKNVITKTPDSEGLEESITAGVMGNEIVSNDTVYEYNKRNRLIKTTTNGNTTSYKYNSRGQRIEKTVNGSISKYLYEGSRVVMELDENNAEIARNVYGNNLIARKAKNPDTGEDEQFYYMYNGHADVTALITSTGAIEATYYYDAFGNHLEQTGNNDNPYRYSGYRYDEETDMYYLNSRYYDSKIARFITEDAFTGDTRDPLSLNRYAYCAINPIKYKDPSGKYWIIDQYLPYGADKYYDWAKEYMSSSYLAKYRTYSPFSLRETYFFPNEHALIYTNLSLDDWMAYDEEFINKFTTGGYTDEEGNYKRYKLVEHKKSLKEAEALSEFGLGFVPYLGAASGIATKGTRKFIEYATGVVGGNSQTSSYDLLKAGIGDAFGLIAAGSTKKLGFDELFYEKATNDILSPFTDMFVDTITGPIIKTGESASIAFIDSIIETLEGEGYYEKISNYVDENEDMVEEVMFELFELGNVSLYSNSAETLEYKALFAQQYIYENQWLFNRVYSPHDCMSTKFSLYDIFKAIDTDIIFTSYESRNKSWYNGFTENLARKYMPTINRYKRMAKYAKSESERDEYLKKASNLEEYYNSNQEIIEKLFGDLDSGFNALDFLSAIENDIDYLFNRSGLFDEAAITPGNRRVYIENGNLVIYPEDPNDIY
jgi:RHS repeat-associated protein